MGMARRSLHKLSDVSIKAEKKPGRHSDGGGLYLNVSSTGSKSWLFMWTPRGGKRREMGLGSYPTVSLAKARAKAANCRRMVDEGVDPIAERATAAVPTFGSCADQFIETIKSEWRNEKHAYQWRQTLTDRCAPIRDKLVSELTTEDMLKVLKPIWTERNETASRLRGRIERVLNYAKVKGWRSGENPAAWRDNLRNLLPKRPRLARGHHPAMPYADVPAFMARLREREGMAARALEFTILTAARSGESIGARWSEIDFEKALWTVPEERMKAGERHDVPLSDRALQLLSQLKETSTSEVVFASASRRSSLSNMAMLMLLRRMGHAELTVHGFRSAFRDWCGDQTSFSREVAEAALAHKIGNVVEQAYRRGTALEKRRGLMAAWASFVEPRALNVVPMKRKPTVA